jgi:hypothetical protein
MAFSRVARGKMPGINENKEDEFMEKRKRDAAIRNIEARNAAALAAERAEAARNPNKILADLQLRFPIGERFEQSAVPELGDVIVQSIEQDPDPGRPTRFYIMVRSVNIPDRIERFSPGNLRSKHAAPPGYAPWEPVVRGGARKSQKQRRTHRKSQKSRRNSKSRK